MTDVVRNRKTGAIVPLTPVLEARTMAPDAGHLEIIRDWLPPGAKRKPGRPTKAQSTEKAEKVAVTTTSKKKASKKKASKKQTKQQSTYAEIEEKIKSFSDAEDELDAFFFEQMGVHLDQRVGVEQMKADALKVIESARGNAAK